MKPELRLSRGMRQLLPIFLTVIVGCSGPATDNDRSLAAGNAVNVPMAANSSVSAIEFAKRLNLSLLPVDSVPDYSRRVYGIYLKQLDPTRIYFLNSDISEFDPDSTQLWPELQSGSLFTGRQIFDRYLRRMQERHEYAMDLLRNHYDALSIEKNEYVDERGDNTPWLQSIDQSNHAWQKKVRLEKLELTLAGIPPNEIKQQLLSRHELRLQYLAKGMDKDFMEIFFNSFALALDPHNRFFSTKNVAPADLSLVGIGAVLKLNLDHVEVNGLVRGGPAEGKLQVGDLIEAVSRDGVNYKSIVGWRLDDAVNEIRGQKNTTLYAKVRPGLRSNEMRTVAIERREVQLSDFSVSGKLVQRSRNGIGYTLGVIRVPSFYVDFSCLQRGEKDCKAASRDLSKVINELGDDGAQGLILDLRNNGGGALQEANALAGLFLPQGPTFQVKSRNSVDTLTNPHADRSYKGRLVVLVNRASAAASEIVAGTLRDYQVAVVVGENTFGMGSAQSLQTVPEGQLKITRGEYYRMTGQGFNVVGVTPDVMLPSTTLHSEVGETSLPFHSQANRIAPLEFNPVQDLGALIPKLAAQSTLRRAQDPDFIAISKLKDQVQRENSKTKFSLDRSVSLKERDQENAQRLAIENARRKQAGLPLVDEVSSQSEKMLVDAAWQTEAENVLMDWMALSD